MSHISQNEFEKLIWLPISDRINQRVISTTFKFVNDIGPNFLNEVFQWTVESNRTLRNDYRRFKHPLRKTTATTQKMKFSINDFLIRRKLRIWSHLLKKFLMENFIFCAVCWSKFAFFLRSLEMEQIARVFKKV